jgi:diguanylate cyclase (GGDEF)-like protein/PAS domain S-box-containing protein
LLGDIRAMASIGIWEIDPATTRIVATPEAADIFDVARASRLVTADIMGFFPEPAASQLRRSLAEAVLTGAPFDLELRAVTAAKKAKWLRVVGHADFADSGLTRLHGAVTDITRTKLETRVPQDSHEFVRSVLDSISDAIAVLDGEGLVVAVNEPWRRLAAELSTEPQPAVDDGEIGASFLGRSGAWSSVPDDLKAGIHSVIAREATFYRAEHRCQAPHAGRWFSLRATPMESGDGGAVVVRTDITARKQAETVLAESEELYRSLMMAMSDGVVLQDDTAAIIAFNDSALRILGVTADQLVGRTSFDPRWRAIHEDGSPFAGETHPAIETLRTGVPQNDVVMGVHKPDGALVWISVSVQPLFKEGRAKPWRLVVTMHDITEQRRAEHEASIAQAMLEAEFDLSPDAMLVVDQRGARLSYNTQYLEMWGLTSDVLETEDHNFVRRWVAPLLLDPEGFLERIREIDADLEAYSYDELHLRDGRTIERYSAPLRLNIGEIRGRVWFFRDITERLKSAADQSLLAAVVNSSPDGIVSVDLDGRVTTWNRGAERILGYAAEEMIGRPGRLASADGAGDESADDVMAQIRGGTEDGTFEVRTLRKDGAPVELSVVFASVRDRDGAIIGGAYIGRDVTERKRAEAELVRMARFDGLTGLLNRTSFADALREAAAKPRADDRPMAVVLVDLDHFKDINDTLGYHTGDWLLMAVANRIAEAVGNEGVVARFSANAFAVLFENLPVSELDRGAQRLLDTVGQPLMLDGSPFRVGASAGVAVHDSPDVGTFMSKADIALHRAKRDNPGGVRRYTQAMDEAVHRRMQLGSDLRAAMATRQFHLAYQPQTDAESGTIIGAEALLRWTHPASGLVGPAEFMPIAERIGLAPGIGRWVIGEACRQIRLWLDAGLTPPPVAVNLSATQFIAPGELERDLEEAMARYRLTPQRLELELTETVLMESATGHNDTLMRLRTRGFSLSIDDFGTGYSSLDYLRRFPVDRIKIDQTFVRDLDSTRGTEAIVKAVIGLAEQLSMSVMAEGVETQAQRDLLRRWNCRLMQGYHFSRPVDAATFTQFLKSDQRLPV